MNGSSFPTMLSVRPTMISRFTREDLLLVGITYFILSLLRISGVKAMVFITLLLLLYRYVRTQLQAGFIKYLRAETKLDWKGGL